VPSVHASAILRTSVPSHPAMSAVSAKTNPVACAGASAPRRSPA
jgi:hypothetical protein